MEKIYKIIYTHMKQSFYFATIIVALLMCLTSCGHKLTTDEAINAIVLGEQDRLPLLVQKMSDVESITIDSMRIRIEDEPMSGYLYTTWNYIVKYTKRATVEEMMRGNYYHKEIEENREKQVIVSVDNIHQSTDRKGYIEWETDWESAYKVILHDMLNH